MKFLFILSLPIFLNIFTCIDKTNAIADAKTNQITIEPVQSVRNDDLKNAYFASGCFWCVEAIFEHVKGVEEAVSGYSGGHKDSPTYRQVSYGSTGHAEVVEVQYNPNIVDFKTLVKVFYGSQDPTTIGQSPDFGSAYRSVIFYQNEEEKQIATDFKAEIQKDYSDKVVTEIVPFQKFWIAEDYHQDYEKLNPNYPYIVRVSKPRLERFKAKFPELIK